MPEAATVAQSAVEAYESLKNQHFSDDRAYRSLIFNISDGNIEVETDTLSFDVEEYFQALSTNVDSKKRPVPRFSIIKIGDKIASITW
jgi:hypothetical protein